jgi:hypothetical protein
MAGRGRASSQKKQKEIARLEKRQQKAQRKQERKTEPRPEEDDLRVLDGPQIYGIDDLPE